MGHGARALGTCATMHYQLATRRRTRQQAVTIPPHSHNPQHQALPTLCLALLTRTSGGVHPVTHCTWHPTCAYDFASPDSEEWRAVDSRCSDDTLRHGFKSGSALQLLLRCSSPV